MGFIKNLFKSREPTNYTDDDGLFDYVPLEGLTTSSVVESDSDLFAVINKLSNDLSHYGLGSTNPTIDNLLKMPSFVVSPKAFYKGVYASLLFYGEAFVYLHRQNGKIVTAELLRNQNVNYNQNDYVGGLKYNITFDDSKQSSIQGVPQSDVLHFKLFTFTGREAKRPIDALSDDLKLKRKLYKFASESIDHAIKLDGNLKIVKDSVISGKLRDARARKIKKDTGANILVTDSAEEFTPINSTDEADRLISQLNWTTEQIAKVYDIPSDFLGGKGDQQSNLEQIDDRYKKSLRKYTDILCDEIDFKLGGETTVADD